MDEKTIHERYGRYYEVLRGLSEFPLLEIPTIDKLLPSKPLKALMQSAYREIKEVDFNGGLIDFFSWISTAHVIYILKQSVSIDAPQTEWVWAIISNYEKNREDTRNLMRLFNRSMYFYVYLNNEIRNEERDLLGATKENYNSVDILLNQTKCTCMLAGFFELLIYEDLSDGKCSCYEEVLNLLEKIK